MQNKQHLAIILAVLTMLFLASTAIADTVSELKQKAEEGDATSQNNLAARYLAGNGVEKDYKLAFKWFEKASNQGLSAAQGNLARMYEKGMGVPKDIVKQHMWLSLSASNGAAMAKYTAKKIAREMTPEQLEESKRMVAEWEKEYGSGK